ncbi:hypothetical protein HMPREF9163_02111 [Selenomonas sp. oral taxon 138 str. F0429]|nr:hypothetical protein HMPREF9163_02111 [Selenomonas sp. oral taxon 138 str. F0429]
MSTPISNNFCLIPKILPPFHIFNRYLQFYTFFRAESRSFIILNQKSMTVEGRIYD